MPYFGDLYGQQGPYADPNSGMGKGGDTMPYQSWAGNPGQQTISPYDAGQPGVKQFDPNQQQPYGASSYGFAQPGGGGSFNEAQYASYGVPVAGAPNGQMDPNTAGMPPQQGYGQSPQAMQQQQQRRRRGLFGAIGGAFGGMFGRGGGPASMASMAGQFQRRLGDMYGYGGGQPGMAQPPQMGSGYGQPPQMPPYNPYGA